MVKLLIAFLVTFWAETASAQQPVNKTFDDLSYATATVNPTIAVVDAWKSSDRLCRFGRLAVAEAIGNGLTLTLKHFVVSPRPCLDCQPDGFPSGHTMNSTIGVLSSRWGFMFAVATGEFRVDAHRHTPLQVLAGLGIGAGAEVGSTLLLPCKQ